MTDTELDRFVHEKVTGKKGQIAGQELYDTYTGRFVTYLKHNEHWTELLNWAMKQEWWSEFVNDIYLNSTRSWELIEDLIANERSLAEHIAEYLEVKRCLNT